MCVREPPAPRGARKLQRRDPGLPPSECLAADLVEPGRVQPSRVREKIDLNILLNKGRMMPVSLQYEDIRKNFERGHMRNHIFFDLLR